MKIIYTILALIFFIPYFLAYSISHFFKIDGYEDMPTVREWFTGEE